MATLISLSLGVGILEIIVRLRTKSDVDGNLTAFGGRIKPFALPVEWTRKYANKLAKGKNACFRYDPDLGWMTNPGARCKDGRYVYDRAGIRTSDPRRVPSTKKEPGVLRVGLFGDSFTHGDDVALADSWGYVLEQILVERGLPVEVFNFGVGGYGMDQAFLRWRKQGAAFGLDAVVFGFQSENILRNVNMIRVLYWWRTHLPFTKPRFILQGDELVVINQPALRPEALPDVLADLPRWELLEHEAFYDPADYEPRWWRSSRLLGYLGAWRAHEIGRLFYAGQTSYYSMDGPAATLTLRILEEFEREVRDAGSAFYVVHLPKAIDVARLSDDPESLWYAELREEIARRHTWIETTEGFLAAGEAGVGIDGMFRFGEHFSPEGNRVVAHAVADALASASR